MNNTIIDAPTCLEPAQETVSRFNRLLADLNLSYFITWRWEGWRKYGVICITPKREWYEPANILDREEFSRSESTWRSSDKVIDRVRTGSPKHRALQVLIARLARQAAQQK